MANSAGSSAQVLGATAPTGAEAQATQAPAKPTRQVAPAKVTFKDGRLIVTADNSSLNQILRDISTQNGMKITGGVPEERVFGNYGPKLTSAVLNDLLEGTKTNVLVREDAHHVVLELVLTPRTGGATPPSPGAVANTDGDDANVPPQPGERRRGGYQVPANGAEAFTPPQQPQANPQANPQSNQEPPNTEQPNAEPPNTEQPPAADATTEESPNGVKTPQQIYDQLMKMQQPQQDPNPQP